eukprot:gene34267-44268_t
MSDYDWALIMEDDAVLNPKVDQSRAFFYVKKAIHYARQDNPVDGFIYFGICHGGCRKKISGFSQDRDYIVGSRCFGHCTHAYAVTKNTAKNFFGLMYSDKFLFNNTSVQIDRAMNNFFKSSRIVHRSLHAMIAGFNIQSPDEIKHVGLMYQWKRTNDTKMVGTSLRSNDFQPQTCVIMRGDGGSIPALLQQYAVLIGLCVGRNASLHPLQCASFVSTQKNPIFDVFSERLNVRKVACAPNSVVVTDSQILMAKVPIQDAFSRLKYGSTLVGSFTNFPLSSAGLPWLRQCLDSASPYDHSLVDNEKGVSNSAWSWLSEWMPSRVIDSVSCAPTATKVCVHVSTDGYSKEEITLARSFYTAVFYYLCGMYPKGVALQLFLDKTVKDSDLRDLLSLQPALYPAPICMIPPVKRYGGVVQSVEGSSAEWEAEHDVWTIQQLQGCSRIVVAKSEIGWWAAYLSNAEVFVSSQDKYIPTAWTIIR